MDCQEAGNCNAATCTVHISVRVGHCVQPACHCCGRTDVAGAAAWRAVQLLAVEAVDKCGGGAEIEKGIEAVVARVTVQSIAAARAVRHGRARTIPCACMQTRDVYQASIHTDCHHCICMHGALTTGVPPCASASTTAASRHHSARSKWLGRIAPQAPLSQMWLATGRRKGSGSTNRCSAAFRIVFYRS